MEELSQQLSEQTRQTQSVHAELLQSQLHSEQVQSEQLEKIEALEKSLTDKSMELASSQAQVQILQGELQDAKDTIKEQTETKKTVED